MGISYSTYLFDAAGFYQQMQPLIPALEAGDYQTLYQVAKSTMEKRPELWPVLDEFFLGAPFEEPGEQPSRQRLLMMVLSQYLRLIPNFNPNGGWDVLQAALLLIGWDHEEARRLLFGDSMCTLLRPGVPYQPLDYLGHLDERLWCALSANWIDPISIDQFAEHLDWSRAAYNAAITDPRPILARSFWGPPDPEIISELVSTWSTAALMGIYEDEVKVLATARQARTALAVSLVW